MIPQTTPKTIRTWLPRVLEWSLLFLALLLAIWLVTREANAPQLILLLLLYIIAINFTLPPAYGSVGLVPVVAVGSVLVVGLETAVILTLISLTIAELARPLWNPMWDLVNLQRPSWAQRISNMALHLLALLSSGLIYRQLGGAAPLNEDGLQNILAFAGLAVGYGLSHFLLALLGQLIARRPLRSFLADNSLSILTASLLAQPFAIFGGITFVRSGLPIFVIFSLGVMLFSVVTWISWQRRFVAEQQLVQFGRLNDVSISLRETLELPVVLSRTHQHVTALVPADDFAISLCDDAGNWQRFQDDAHFEGGSVDDFTRWTAQQQRLLNLHRRNFHYAAQHQLALPQPTPTAWLGIPLMSGMQTTGVMVLQRFGNSQPFSRWNQEILSALAAQVSSAIENAHLYSETLRLYNLTDEALARRVEQLQALLNTVQEGVLMLDTQGRVLLINPTAAALLAQPSTHMMNKVLDEETGVTHLGYTANEWQAQQTRLQNQQPPQGNGHIFPASLQPSDGAARRVTIERTEFAVYAQDGLVMGWLILLRDITEEQA
ncbi:MAG: GAF domain-containing protein, partial [Anaerolineales bacterium]|nr:GAF domain-containing protein [Anaerolineales bacterium]